MKLLKRFLIEINQWRISGSIFLYTLDTVSFNLTVVLVQAANKKRALLTPVKAEGSYTDALGLSAKVG